MRGSPSRKGMSGMGPIASFITEAAFYTTAYTATLVLYATKFGDLVLVAHVATAVFLLLLLGLLVRGNRDTILWGGPHRLKRDVLTGVLAVVPLLGISVVWLLADLPVGVKVTTALEAPMVMALGYHLFFATYEECLFRGLILGWLKEHHGTVTAVVWSSLLFGAAHAVGTWSAPTLVYYSIGGLFFALLALWRSGIIAPLTCHLAFNLLVTLL